MTVSMIMLMVPTEAFWYFILIRRTRISEPPAEAPARIIRPTPKPPITPP